MGGETEPKRIGLLHTLLPDAKRFALLTGSQSAANRMIDIVGGAAASIGVKVEAAVATTVAEIDLAFASLAQKHVDAVQITTDSLIFDRFVQIATLSARYGLPAIHFERQFPAVGGLMSYGPNYLDQVHQVGVYVARVLNGEKPADLPVIQPTKFDLVINMQTAKILALSIPPTLLAIADEVIE
jgi:putative ABC transport system substrate-binding protein